MTAGAFFLDTVVPSANRRAAEVLGEREARREWRSNFVHQTENDEVLTVGQLYVSTGAMSDGVLMESRDAGGTLRHVWSAQADWSAETGWTFLEGYFRLVRPGGEEAAYAFDRYARCALPSRRKSCWRSPGKTRRCPTRSWADTPRWSSAREAIPGTAGHAASEAVDPSRDPDHRHLRRPPGHNGEEGGRGVRVGASLASTLLYMILMRFFGAVGVTGVLSPFWAAWAPNMLFLATGVILQARVRT